MPRSSKHRKEQELMDATTRKLNEEADRHRREYEDLYGPLGGARLVETAEGAAVHLSYGYTTPAGGSMDQDRMDELVAERVERNERWGRSTDRATALAELVNEGSVDMWEEPAPVQRREPRGGGVEVRDDF